MARCALGAKKLRKYSRLFGRTFTNGLVRGNTGHRVDLQRSDGLWFHYWPNARAWFGDRVIEPADDDEFLRAALRSVFEWNLAASASPASAADQ